VDHFGQSKELVLEFPCNFSIKVVGRADVDFAAQVCTIAATHDETFSSDKLQYRESSAGKYHSLTLNIHATSKEQLNAIYQSLKACEWVLWAL